MNRFFDPDHLREDQYRTSQNLDARVALHRRFSTNPYPWQEWVFDQLKLPLEAEILEVGCGPAYLWVENKSRIPTAWNLTLTDISHGMATAARANLGGSKHIALSLTSAQSLAFSSRAFDGVIANHMLYHVPNMDTAIKEIRRVLKPNGLFYSTTNGFRHLIEIWEWVQDALPERNDILRSREIVTRYSLQNSNELLSKHFQSVNLFGYPDSLEISEVQPVLDFVASSSIQVNISREEISTYGEYLERKLERHGVLRVTKDIGIFVATSQKNG